MRVAVAVICGYVVIEVIVLLVGGVAGVVYVHVVGVVAVVDVGVDDVCVVVRGGCVGGIVVYCGIAGFDVCCGVVSVVVTVVVVAHVGLRLLLLQLF